MKTVCQFLMIPLLSALLPLATAAEKYALLIGVTTYEHAQMNHTPLKYPEADANAVAELLKSNGYEVRVLTGKQATLAGIEAELAKLEKQGTSDGVAFIGLFGHGVQYGDDAFFGPYNTAIRKVTDSKGRPVPDNDGNARLEPDPTTMISMKRLLEALTACGASNRILIADCCREDPSAARGRAFGSNVKVSDLEPGTAAIFSCSNTEQAFEHDAWGHGAFTKAFLDYCSNLPGDDATANAMSNPLFRNVQTMVKDKTNGRSNQTVNPLVSGIVDLKLTLKPSRVAETDAPANAIGSSRSMASKNALSKSALPKSSPSKNPTSPGSTSTEAVTSSIGMTLQSLKAGEFRMGSAAQDQNHNSDEAPMHRVGMTKGFYMGTTEVTQGQWFAVMETRPWQGQPDVQEGDDFPATYISWADAVEFCQKLTASEGINYRLPTEAEWEYACRAGSELEYSFERGGKRLPEYAWFQVNADAIGERYAHAVRTKNANQFGLFDMHGNVAEWCQDSYSETAYLDRAGGDRTASGRPVGGRVQMGKSGKSGANRPGNSGTARGLQAVVADPLLEAESEFRVVRGGSWGEDALLARCATRSKVQQDQKLSTIGFRVVRQ